MNSHASYIFSAYSNILNRSKKHLLQIGNLSTDGIPIPSFDEDVLINLCLEAQEIFKTEKNMLIIDGDTIIVGDIHGSLHDLLQILNYIESDRSKVLFLGDYVDRGVFSLECITILFSLKVLYPDKFFLIRGNHEFDAMCSQYGFKKEILNYHNPKKFSENSSISIKDEANFSFEDDTPNQNINLCDQYYANHVNTNCYKYTEKLYDSFIEAFSYLPIGAIINNSTICLHGGISPQLKKINDLNKCIQRPITDFTDNVLLGDIIWGDPTRDLSQLFNDNPRGYGKLFNGVALANFLKSNNLKRLIRGHECVATGFQEMFNEKCLTVFSASSYSLNLNNKSSIIKIHENTDKVEPITFEPLPRLKKCDACYYKVQAFDDDKEMAKIMLSFCNFNISTCSSVFSDTSDHLDTEMNIDMKSALEFKSADILPENKNVSFKKLGQPLANPYKLRKDKYSISKKRLSNYSFNTGIMNKKMSSANCNLSSKTSVSLLPYPKANKKQIDTITPIDENINSDKENNIVDSKTSMPSQSLPSLL